MVPSLTIRLQVGGSAETQEAADWVEYVNGAANSTWGRVRAARGHPEPYNVTYFYLGNEMSIQHRFPDYPHSNHMLRPPNPRTYQQMLRNLLEPILLASPHPLRLFTVSGSRKWNYAWAEAIGDHVYATSFHGGYFPQPTIFNRSAVTACAMRPRGEFLDSVRYLRAQLDATGKSISISADEWGLGPPWKSGAHGAGNGSAGVRFSVAHGMYAAGFLGMVTRESESLDLKFTNYFEPVNEGAIAVSAFSSSLTPVAQVMRLFAAHIHGTKLVLPQAGNSCRILVLF